VRLVVALCAALVALGACAPRAAAPPAPVADAGSVEYARARTVLVQVDTDGDGARDGWGSGVVVSSGTVSVVATAAHVIRCEDCTYTVVTDGGRELAAARHVLDEAGDVGLLVVDQPMPAAELAPGAALGDRVMHVGYPMELTDQSVPHLTVSRGTVSTFLSAGRIRLTGVDIFFGSSGGPIFDAEGRVVCLAVSMAAYGVQKSDYCTSNQYIARLMLHTD